MKPLILAIICLSMGCAASAQLATNPTSAPTARTTELEAKPTNQPVQPQISLAYFPFQSYLSLASNTTRIFWVEYRLQANTFFTNMNMELAARINLRRLHRISYYTGLGYSANPAARVAGLPLSNGYFLDFGARMSPFERYPAAQLIFELSPYVNRQWNGGNLRVNLGLAYSFVRTPKN